MAIPTNPLTYNAFVSALALMAVENVQTVGGVVQGVSAEFTALIPLALSYAENRIQRDVGLGAAQTVNNSYTLIAGSNLLTISTQDFSTIQTVSINGVPLLPVSKEWLQNVWGTSASSAQPMYFAFYGGDSATGGATSMNLIVGPWPDGNYNLSIVGTNYLPSLYKFANSSDAASQTTFISRYMPDVLLAAAMIFVSGYQRDFSPAGSDPQMPVNWEQQYNALLGGARTEEARKQFSAAAWSSMPPTPMATAAR